MKTTTTTETTDENEGTMTEILKSLKALTIQVESMEKHHQSICNVAFSDKKEKALLDSIKSASNINDLHNCDLLEWFYDDEQKTGILRCKPCFDLHVKSKPILSTLTPLKAQRFLSSKDQNNFSYGITYNKDSCSDMMIGGNEFWYRQKHHIIEHLCLIGEGSVQHKKAYQAHVNEKTRREKSLAISENLFRCAIADLKLGAAALHFESLIALISS